MFLKKVQVDLKLQHRISRSNSSSRYSENTNSQTYLCDDTCMVLQQSSKDVLRKTPVLKSFLVKLLARDLLTPAQFSSEFARFFRTPILYNIWLSYVIQNRCSKKSPNIHGKIHVKGCIWYYWEYTFLHQAAKWYFAGLTVSQYLRY